MRGFVLFSVVVLASLAVTFAVKCQHNDPSSCTITCTNTGEVVGCEHDICTCVPDNGGGAGSGQACTDAQDCGNLHCDKHLHKHCLDGTCQCTH